MTERLSEGVRAGAGPHPAPAGGVTIGEDCFSEPALRRSGRSYLGRCLAVSLALHALLLSLQFGEPGIGLPWFAWTWGERRARVPAIEAVLVAPTPAPTAGNILPPSATADQGTASPANKPLTSAASLRPSPALPPARTSKPPRAPEPSRPPAPVAATPILAVERDSAWRLPMPPPPVETGEQTPVEPDTSRETPTAAIPEAAAPSPPEPQPVPAADPRASARAQEEALERERLETAARLAEERRQADEAAAAARQAEARERQRAEDAARLARERWATEQAALAQAKAEEAARLDAERQQAAKAAAMRQVEALQRQQAEEAARLAEGNRRAEEAAAARAEAQARARADESARMAAKSRPSPAVRAGEPASAPGAAAGPAGAGAERAARSAGDGTGQPGLKGADMAARALEQARSGLRGLPADVPAGVDRSRRGSILGGGAQDIPLAFYGEAWREKVERIGEMNYPRLSKDRFYDQLVVTVSINSDGTLAGVRIDKSSGYADMDDAVRRIVEMSAPFAAFPPDLKRRYDVVDITRTWSFVERPHLLRQ